MLVFAPGTRSLVCEFCGEANQIDTQYEEIHEYDLHQTLIELANAPSSPTSSLIHCDNCSANFKFEKNFHAGECPFCGSAIVTQTAKSKTIKPRSLLPFQIDEDQAKKLFQRWIKGLWFAPNKVKRFARSDSGLAGVYLPFWTFDSYTVTQYTGMRGVTYYVTRRVSYVQNGRTVSRLKRVPKIRWTPVRGTVSRFFDDVLVGASRSLPRQLLERLEPWDLYNLIPYDEKYLSGLKSEYYQVELDEGFDRAKQIMEGIIYQDIAYDIGGDHQRIHRQQTRHSENTFKHCLLPVWSAAFHYRNKSYRFVVNGRTGLVQGERPYSFWKIGFAVFFTVLALIGLFLVLDQSGALQQIQYDYSYY